VYAAAPQFRHLLVSEITAWRVQKLTLHPEGEK